MGRKAEQNDRDRYLSLRGGFYVYKRRVPSSVSALDQRGPTIRISLGTKDVAQARAMRDIYERADNEYWAALLVGDDAKQAEAVYRAAAARAAALGFTYRTTSEILAYETGHSIIARLRALHDVPPGSHTEQVLVGTIDKPKVTVSRAFEIYVDEIVADELLGKSSHQRHDWNKVKKRAVTNFIAVVGDKSLDEITRDDAIKFFNHWRDRIAPKKGKPSHTASSGNRDLGNMRVLYREYFRYAGVQDARNPFDNLSFSEKVKRSRPPFPTEWITSRILAPGALAGLNAEGRGVILAIIATGARPSEICNLGRDEIKIDAKVPHLVIEPRLDPDDPREIKTVSSIRKVPLGPLGIAVFKKHRDGFPRYRNRESSMSATLNKHLRIKKLFPSARHTVYSLRHSFEDRMKVAGIDTELRMILMGHTIDRPSYGEGGSLEWRHAELLKIELPFDPSIV